MSSTIDPHRETRPKRYGKLAAQLWSEGDFALTNPFASFAKRTYGRVKQILLRSAEQMPDHAYDFKPTPAVRSFGQILGHVADAQYLFFSFVLIEKMPRAEIERTKTCKGDLIVALRDAFTYGERAYDGITDRSAVELVNVFGGSAPKLLVLELNNNHLAEHIGSLNIYLRMNNIVPPNSEPHVSLRYGSENGSAKSIST
jgi:uncharacterized damage-inducible protein DinB